MSTYPTSADDTVIQALRRLDHTYIQSVARRERAIARVHLASIVDDTYARYHLPEPVTYYPPLTEAEFAAGGACMTVCGISLIEDEDACYVFAWGHHDKAAYAAAVNEFDRLNGAYDDAYVEDDVMHSVAVTTRPPEEWFISWDAAVVQASDQPSFPVTVVSR